MARIRRADRPVDLATRASHASRVSVQLRGPARAITIPLARSFAVIADDISLTPVRLFDFSDMVAPMVLAMAHTTYKRSYRIERLGEALRRVAGKLIATQRIEKESGGRGTAAESGCFEAPTKRGGATPGEKNRRRADVATRLGGESSNAKGIEIP